MTSAFSNAFLRYGQSDEAHPRGSLANMLVPMRAIMESTSGGTSMSLTPLRFQDVMKIWTSIEQAERASNLIINLEAKQAPLMNERTTLARLATDAGIVPLDVFDDDLILLDDDALEDLIERGLVVEAMLVRITGPVETSDAKAIVAALDRGESPLDAELRAVATLHMPRERCLRFESRGPAAALAMVAESFRHYIAAQRRVPVASIAAPVSWQIQRLLEPTGEMCVRPIETEVFTTSIDVGVCVTKGGPTRPADHSLVYDVFSNTWHDEP